MRFAVRALLLVAMLGAFGVSGQAGAQAWPTKPVRLVVSQAAGGTPPAVVQRLNREPDKVLKEPEVVQKLREFGMFTDGAETPEATAEYIRAQRAAWGRMVKEIGLQPE